uniref:Uncharacterized protein n=1 Tax=Zea mays TaxID=4577 RepID=B6T9L0_MAIZE|nr:hypothetical protein [Zea mays]
MKTTSSGIAVVLLVAMLAVQSAVQELPGDCGLSLSYNITPDIDCDKIE